LKKIYDSRFKSLLVIGALTILAFSSIFPNKFVLDDFDYIVNWPLIQDWKNLPRFFIGFSPPEGQDGIYSPLKTLFHALTYHLFGLRPLGYHVVSLFIHLAGTYFVYRIILFLTKENCAAFLGGLFFGLHPAPTEIIFNITGSIDALGVVFLFAAFYEYFKARDPAGGLKTGGYIRCLLYALLAIYTHELCVAIPLLFLWVEVCFFRDKMAWSKRLMRVAPFFMITGSYVLAKFLTLKSITRGGYLYDSFYLTMLVIIKAWAQYVLISFFPVVLTHNHVISKGIYSFDAPDFDKAAVLSQSLLDPQVLLSLVFLGGIFTAAARAWNKQPLVPFCVGWFFISLLPGANIIPSSVYFAERYLYPGMMGFCLLCGVFFSRLLQSPKTLGFIRRSFLAGLIVFSLGTFYAVRTWWRGRDFRNNVTLFESAVRANPRSALMRTDLGIVCTWQGEYEKALASLEKAAAIRPEDPAIYFAMAGAYYNLAGLYAFWGMDLQARSSLSNALLYFRKRGEAHKAQEFEKAFTERFGILK